MESVERRARIHVVAAYSRNRVIGSDGCMPWHVPEDLAHFKQLTSGHPIVMGRRTFESLGRALPGRTNIVVTRDRQWSAGPDVLVAHTLEDAIDQAARALGGTEIMVIGGGVIFAQALAIADQLDLSEIHLAPDGDTFFPDFDSSEWMRVDGEVHERFTTSTWVRRQPSPIARSAEPQLAAAHR